MSFLTFILAWIISVIFMTLFSAIWSQVSGNQFREPALLSQLLSARPIISTLNEHSYALGWVIHFLFGIVFLGFYELLYFITGVDRTLFWTLMFGTFLGLLGIMGWKLMFKIVDFSSHFNYFKYYIHLYFAHLVFSVSAFLVYISVHG